MITLEPYRHHYTYNDYEVPGVTTILGVVAKPQLITWANNLGLQGIKVSDYNNNVTRIGALVHAYIQGMITGEQVDDSPATEEQRTIAQACRQKFVYWMEGHSVKFLGSEISLNGSEFGGTLDALMEIDGRVTIVDFKTSKDIYPEYFAQLAAYHSLWRVRDLAPQLQPVPNVDVVDIAVLLLAKEIGDARFAPVTTISDRYMQAKDFFYAAKNLYYKKRLLY